MYGVGRLIIYWARGSLAFRAPRCVPASNGLASAAVGGTWAHEHHAARDVVVSGYGCVSASAGKHFARYVDPGRQLANDCEEVMGLTCLG